MDRPLWQFGAAELARHIATGEIRSAEVVDSCIARIEAVNGRLNAVVARRFDEARREARSADELQQSGQPLGPLHGVPMTIKECFFVAGLPATLGLTRLRDNRATSDGPPVVAFRRAGAIVLGVTNVPQLMIMHETDNPLYGKTANPWDPARTCGGSTGGEGAIIAAGGSLLGLGSDLGGSIRLPCHWCGIHGILPTAGRFTREGTLDNLPGMQSLVFQPGPMARHVEDLILAMRVLCRAHGSLTPANEELPADAAAGPSSWPDISAVDLHGLKVAMFDDDGIFPPSPAVRRAVHDAAAVLSAAGVTIVPWSFPQMRQAVELYFGLISADGGVGLRRLLADGPVHLEVRKLLALGKLSRIVKRALAAGLEFRGAHREAWLLRAMGARSARQYWELTHAVGEYRRCIAQEMHQAGIAAVICPPHALPAPLHGLAPKLPAAAGCAFVPNLLGFPAGVVATTKVRPSEDLAREDSVDPTDRRAAATEQGSAGLPVGVQVVAPAWREDVVLAVMAALERHFQGQPDYPGICDK